MFTSFSPALKYRLCRGEEGASSPRQTDMANDVLDSMEKSGEAKQIFDKWFGSDTTYKLPRSFKIEPIKG